MLQGDRGLGTVDSKREKGQIERYTIYRFGVNVFQ